MCSAEGEGGGGTGRLTETGFEFAGGEMLLHASHASLQLLDAGLLGDDGLVLCRGDVFLAGEGEDRVEEELLCFRRALSFVTHHTL